MTVMTDIDPQALADRYVALWTEPDPAARRRTITQLWSPDGTHNLLPPEEMIKEAADLGFAAPALTCRGHAAIERRVSRSYDKFVATGEYTFRARPGALQVGDVVKFEWESVQVDGDVVTGGGSEVLLLGEDGTIRQDSMFPH